MKTFRPTSYLRIALLIGLTFLLFSSCAKRDCNGHRKIRLSNGVLL
ncbi:MAG: hypothetical protein ACK5AS_01935 [Bacteroidota bacterium]|jgi:hypothetical protein|nr:hypothetical protein [Bacteroidota bacterium]